MYTLRRSLIDPRFVEIVCADTVVQEIAASLAIRKMGCRFSSLDACVEWLEKEELRLAKAAAYRLLAGRSYARAALEKKIKQRDFSDSVCKEVVSELERLGYLNDSVWRESAIERELAKGYGPRHIELKLRSQGIDASFVRAAIDRSRQIASIKKLLEKNRKKKGLALMAFLARRGFDSDCISDALRQLKNSL